MEFVAPLIKIAQENPTMGVTAFALVMWYLQWRRNEARDKEFASIQEKTIVALSKLHEVVGTGNTLLTTLLNRRDP